jgi:hypothetical protein
VTLLFFSICYLYSHSTSLIGLLLEYCCEGD